MSKAIVLLLAMLFFRVVLPRRQRRTSTTTAPYGSVFDVAVPSKLACSATFSSKDSRYTPMTRRTSKKPVLLAD